MEIAKVVLETVDVNAEMLTVKVEIAPVNHALSICFIIILYPYRLSND